MKKILTCPESSLNVILIAVLVFTKILTVHQNAKATATKTKFDATRYVQFEIAAALEKNLDDLCMSSLPMS